MTPRKVLNAYRAIKEISGTVFPYKTARAVAALKRKLQAEVDVIADTERALVEKYGGKMTGSRVDFDSAENVTAFQTEYNNFMEQGAEIDLPVVNLSKHTDALRLAPDTIEALEGIVIFEQEGVNSDG